MAVHVAVAVNIFDGVLFCAVLFFHEMSWMRYGTALSQFLTLFLPTFTFDNQLCVGIRVHHPRCTLPFVVFHPSIHSVLDKSQ